MNRNSTEPVSIENDPALAQENEEAAAEVTVEADPPAEEETETVAVVATETETAMTTEEPATAEPGETEEPATTEVNSTPTATAETEDTPATSVDSTAAEVASTETNSPFSELSIGASTVDPTITDGETLFIDNCAKCHGLEGYGNGPSVGSLGAITGNFVLVAMEDYTDEELFAIITHGKGIEMPPWGLVMTEEQRWALVDYVRTLSADDS
jgi:mono/diheme cytochrome c family protein